MNTPDLSIMEVSDNEVKIGNAGNYISMRLEKNLLEVEVCGSIDVETARKVVEYNARFQERATTKIVVLIDLNKAAEVSREVRKIWNELTESDRTARIAFFGLHLVARIAAQFVMNISRNKKMRFFDNREQAYAWLKTE